MLERALRIAAVSAAALAVAGIALYSYVATRTPPAMAGAIVAPSNVALELSNALGTRDLIRIDRVVASTDSWIVVTSSDAPGSEGSRVGVAHVVPGEMLDLRVPLEPGASSSQRLSVVLHMDLGVIGRFEFDPRRPLSSRIRRSSRSIGHRAPVTRWPVAWGSAALVAAERLMALNGVVIKRVVALAPSWLAIYLVGTDGRPNTLAGSTKVPAGESDSVRVEIGPSVVPTRRMLVVLQSDTGVEGRFEFDPARFVDSPDRPYSVDGVEVSSPVFLRNYFDLDASGGM